MENLVQMPDGSAGREIKPTCLLPLSCGPFSLTVAMQTIFDHQEVPFFYYAQNLFTTNDRAEKRQLKAFKYLIDILPHYTGQSVPDFANWILVSEQQKYWNIPSATGIKPCIFTSKCIVEDYASLRNLSYEEKLKALVLRMNDIRKVLFGADQGWVVITNRMEDAINIDFNDLNGNIQCRFKVFEHPETIENAIQIMNNGFTRSRLRYRLLYDNIPHLSASIIYNKDSDSRFFSCIYGNILFSENNVGVEEDGDQEMIAEENRDQEMVAEENGDQEMIAEENGILQPPSGMWPTYCTCL